MCIIEGLRKHGGPSTPLFLTPQGGIKLGSPPEPLKGELNSGVGIKKILPRISQKIKGRGFTRPINVLNKVKVNLLFALPIKNLQGVF